MIKNITFIIHNSTGERIARILLLITLRYKQLQKTTLISTKISTTKHKQIISFGNFYSPQESQSAVLHSLFIFCIPFNLTLL